MKNRNYLFYAGFVFVMCLLFFLPAFTRAAVPTSKIVLTSISSTNTGGWLQENYGLDGKQLRESVVIGPQEYAAGMARLNASQYTVVTDDKGYKITTITRPENTALFANTREAVSDTITAQRREELKSKEEPSKVTNFVIWLFSYTIYLATSVAGFLIHYAGKIIDFFFSADQLASSRMVQSGWWFTRDTLNFVFILVLLAISFSTIAGLETFQMKKVLPSLIFAALMVNFSLAIAGAFLQISNVMTTSIATSILNGSTNEKVQELAKAKKVGSALVIGLMQSSSVGQFYTYQDSDWEKAVTDSNAKLPNRVNIPNNSKKIDPSAWETAKSTPTPKYFLMVINSAIALVMIVIFTVVFIFLAVLMAIRIVMLVILLILSPVPFVFSIIPQAKSYADKWWSNFINYVIFLPVATFFLALAIRLMDTEKLGDTSSLVSQFFSQDNPFSGYWGGVLGSIVDMVFVSIFIFASLLVAKSLGIAGANAVTSAAKRTGLGAARMAAFPAVAAGKMAGHGAAKVGLMAADAAGTGITKIPGGGKVLRGTRMAGRAAQRLYKGQESREQMEEKKKALAGMSEDELRSAYERGNVAAGVKLMENDDLKKEEFAGLSARMPKGTESYNKVQSAWKKKDPVAAIIKDAGMRSKLRSGTEHVKLPDKERDDLEKAFSKMDAEDYAKLEPEDLNAAVNAGVNMPMSKKQLNAVYDSPNTKLQDRASILLKEMEGKGDALKPAQTSLVEYAKNKIKVLK